MGRSSGNSGLATASRKKNFARNLQQNSLAQHWAQDWRALALTQVPSVVRKKNLNVNSLSETIKSCKGGDVSVLDPALAWDVFYLYMRVRERDF